MLDSVCGRIGIGRSTCHPASMLLRSEPSNEPERIQICERLNSLTTWIEGSHTFIVAFAPYTSCAPVYAIACYKLNVHTYKLNPVPTKKRESIDFIE